MSITMDDAMVDSAQADVWGVSAPAFLFGYAVALAVLIGAGLAVRRGWFVGGSRMPTPIQAAYLGHRREGAVVAALAALRVTGAVGVDTETGDLVAGKLRRARIRWSWRSTTPSPAAWPSPPRASRTRAE